MVTALDLEAVEIRGGPLTLASDADVDEMEERLSSKFPDGYRQYVTRLGEGSLNLFVRVRPPWRILAELEEHRGMMSAFWFWESGKVPFGQEQAIESIPVADTFDGDVIVFHPDHPSRIIVLPRGGPRLYARGPDLLETINWVCSGRMLRRFGPGRYFEPFDSRLGPEHAPVDEPPRAGRLPTESISKHRAPGMTAHDALMAYFADLAEVEAWGISNAGGPEAFLGDEPPNTGDGIDELIARAEQVRARYCAPSLAQALRGASVTLSSAPEHDAVAIRVVEEREAREGRVVMRTAEGTDFVFLRRYMLEQVDGEWWITAQTDLGIE